jgi:16S rRNA (cytosine1402-N4)-methyltransferase
MRVDRETPHRPVLLDEAIEGLAIKPDGVYIDGTFGRGGHCEAILEKLNGRGRILAIDKDPEAIYTGLRRFQGERRISIKRSSFAMLRQLADTQGLTGRVNGMLFDLGVSSPQLEDPQRGFSFLRNGPLDMRMDPAQGPTSAAWLARASEKEIAAIIKAYGEERYARRIARAIVRTRVLKPISSTRQLVDIIVRVVPALKDRKHPATRTFQAIRIHINRELDELNAALAQTIEVLAKGGRLVVISFHSLEDRLVKRFIRNHGIGGRIPRGLPLTEQRIPYELRPVGRAKRATEQECKRNPRARSAILRIAERLG